MSLRPIINSLIMFTLVLMIACSKKGESSSVVSDDSTDESTTPPVIRSKVIGLSAVADGVYAVGSELNFQLTFDDEVVVTGLPSVQLKIGTETRAAEYVSGSGSAALVFRYTVVLADEDIDGIGFSSTDIALNGGTIKNDTTEVDIDRSFTTVMPALTNIVIDNRSKITALSAAEDGVYAVGSELNFQLTFDAAVVVTGLPSVQLKIGTETRAAVYVSGSGSTALEFRYTVVLADEDANGIEFNSTDIALNGGTIKNVTTTIDVNRSFTTVMPALTNIVINNSGASPPGQVTGVVTAPAASATVLNVSWSVPASGTAIVNYKVQYREQGTSLWTSAGAPTTNSIQITGVSANKTYEIRVAANNGIIGQYSAIVTVQNFDVMALNPIVWLSATNITNGGTEPANNAKVALWADLTQTATDATTAVPSKQPTYRTNIQNGLPAVYFDGTIDRGLQGGFTRVTNGGLSIFLVGRFIGAPRRAFFEFYRTVPNGQTSDKRGFFFTYGYAMSNTNRNLNSTQFNLWRAYDDGTKSSMWENGVSKYTNVTNEYGPTGFSGSGSYVLGDDMTGGDSLNGYIGEMLIFDQPLTNDQNTAITNYLKNKWGTP